MSQTILRTASSGLSVNRRQFLGGIAAAAAIAVRPEVVSGYMKDGNDRWQMKLSTSSLHYRSLSVTEACQRIASLGFEAVDIWSHFTWAGPLCEHLETALLKMGPEKFAEFLDGLNLKLGSVSCYSAPFSQFAEKVGELGGCVVIRGSQSAPESGQDAKQLTQQMKKFFESLKPDLELAEQFNCSLAIENHSGASLLNRLDSFKAFTDLNRNERLGIALAPFHVQLNGESVEEAIRIGGSQTKFIYAWQHAKDDEEKTLQLPGIGKTDMRPWLTALAGADYQGYVNPFMHHEPEPDEMQRALKKSRDYLLKAYQEVSS